ncbi:MAG: TIM barrel protein [Candidatus Hydrogenedentes bacterium]|nr:TIM barrel protein [Candidatus Hydrogenedentota bacterium]
MNRRDFLAVSGMAAGAAVLGGTLKAQAQDAAFPPFKKAVITGMLPKELSNPDKFALAKRCGFDGLESPPIADLNEAKIIGEQARDAGVPIHSIIFGGWQFPLSDPDPAVQEKGRAAVEQALLCAQAVGAQNILLVPAKVTADVRYIDAYERSQKHIRSLLPVAEQVGVVIAVENVWNDFLLSPLEFAKYVDEFESPWVRAYFDVGNVVAFGYSQDWIRTLGKRIMKVHVKDFKRDTREWPNLMEGSIDWPEVRRALAEIGYEGFITAELKGGDEAYLKDLSERMSKIAAGG